MNSISRANLNFNAPQSLKHHTQDTSYSTIPSSSYCFTHTKALTILKTILLRTIYLKTPPSVTHDILHTSAVKPSNLPRFIFI